MLRFALGISVLALVAAVLLAWNARLPTVTRVAAWDLAVDDAIRSMAVHRAAAAGLAAQLFLLSEQATNAFLHAHGLGPASFLLGLVYAILAIGIRNDLGTRGWWPSRRARAGAPPPPAGPSRPPGHPGSGRSAA